MKISDDHTRGKKSPEETPLHYGECQKCHISAGMLNQMDLSSKPTKHCHIDTHQCQFLDNSKWPLNFVVYHLFTPGSCTTAVTTPSGNVQKRGSNHVSNDTLRGSQEAMQDQMLVHHTSQQRMKSTRTMPSHSLRNQNFLN